MKCTLEAMNQYRNMINEVQKQVPVFKHDLLPNNYVMEDKKGHLHEIPLYDDTGRRINYMRKRNFIIKAQNLPKQFGFEVEVKNLHYDERKSILAKNLVVGKTCISKLFFVFNVNNFLLTDNHDYHAQNSYMSQETYENHMDSLSFI